jgi:hypothetical protein
MQSRHIALVGYFGRGNFGDDCSAVLLGLALRQAGFSFSIYRLCEAYAKPFGFPIATSPEGVLEGADVLLWGGGGLLVPWPDLLYRALFPGVASEFANLVTRATGKEIRLTACSVGGDGSRTSRLTPAYKEFFARSAAFMTVRNPQDLAILERFGVPGACFPDLMWLAGELLPLPVRKPGGMRIAIDLYPSTLLRRFAPYLLPVLQSLLHGRQDCQFFFLDSTNAGCKPYRGLGRFIHGANASPYQFSSPESDLQFLASLDLLISSRLHTPVVAFQYGVPAISLLAEKKTTLLFSNLGLDNLSYGHRRILDLYRLLSCKQSLDAFLRNFRFPDIQALRCGAAGHLRFLFEHLTSGDR